MINIPEEITGIRQWTYSENAENLRHPKHTKYKPEGALDFLEAKNIAESFEPERSFGFYVTKEDPYILGDIDHVADVNDPFSELPPELGYLLKTKETYSEISPSGKGIRYVFKFISLDHKKKLEGHYFLSKEPLQEGQKPRDFQLNIGTPWMRFTNNPTDFSAPRVAVVSLEELQRCFDIKLVEKKDKSVDLIPQETTISIPFSKLRKAVMNLPFDDNPRLQRAYAKTFDSPYDRYEYWLRVLMGIKYYSQLTDKEIDCLNLALTWSKLDPVGFESEENVAKHWRSIRKESDDGTVVTHKSIFSLDFYCQIQWPIPKAKTEIERDMNIPDKPLTTEYENFVALMEFYNMKVYANALESTSYFMTGDADIIDTNFKRLGLELHYEKYYGPISQKELLPLFHPFLQRQGFTGIGHNRTQEFLRNWLAFVEGEINLMRLYFDTPYHKLPESYQDNAANYATSTFDKLFNCLDINYKTHNHEKEKALYRKYYKSWLMGLVRGLYYTGPYDENNCILLLTGKEQRRKSSHFKAFLPPFLRRYIAHTTHDFSSSTNVRDIYKLAADNLIVVWNELEKHLNYKTESNFKDLIDNNAQKFIDKFETRTTEVKPKAIYGATSNQETFRIGTKGSRRLFHIPINRIDTDTMNELCWHPIIAEVREEMYEGLKIKGKLPWLLTKEELQYQASMHDKIRYKGEVESLLWEVYDFEADFEITSQGIIKGVTTFRNDKSGRLKSIRQVITDLDKFGIRTFDLKQNDLKNALEAACSYYTSTQRYPRSIIKPKMIIDKGLAYQGDRSLWVLPPLKTTERDYKNEEAKEVFKKYEDEFV